MTGPGEESPARKFQEAAEAARERGLMIYCCPTALAGRVIQCVMLAPPLNISAHDADEILDRLEPSIGAA